MIAMRSITKQIQVLAVAFVLLGVLAISSIPAHADASLNGWQKGILVQPTSSTDYSSANFQQSMRNAQADGVNYVTLVIPLRQTSVTSSDIYVPIYTPTDQSLASEHSLIRPTAPVGSLTTVLFLTTMPTLLKLITPKSS
jgi:hypothetical protein